MIGFVLVGTNDLRRATEFYDPICAAPGAKRLYGMTNGCTGVMYGKRESAAASMIVQIGEAMERFRLAGVS
jgi:hypothetical protein